MTSRVRAIRGAIQVSQDRSELVSSATARLVLEMMQRNGLNDDDLVSVFFTCTPDLVSVFPAAAARDLGLGHIPLMCATELNIENSMPRVIRVLMHAYSPLGHREIQHVYLDGAQSLRSDLAQ